MISLLYVALSVLLGASWAFSSLCSALYIFEVRMSRFGKIFYMSSVSLLTLVLMCVFYDRAVALRTIIIIVYIFILIYNCAKNISKSLLAFVIFIIEMSTAETSSILFFVIIGYYSLELCFFANSVFVLAMNIPAVLLKRKITRSGFSDDTKKEQIMLLLLTMTAVCIAAALQIVFEGTIIGDFDLNAKALPMFLAVVGVMYITAAIAALGFIKGMREERKNRLILEQQRLLEDMYDTTRIFRHNYKNTLTMLKGYCDNKNYDELSKNISGLTEEMNELNREDQRMRLLEIEDEGMRNIIMLKLIKAEKAGVRFGLKISGRQFAAFKTLEMVNVLGILLDNAIEAAEESDKKEADLDLIGNINVDSISLINTFGIKPNMDKIFDKNYSTKNKDGLGLYYVRKVLNQNENAEFSFDCRDDYFVVNISVLKR